MKFLLVLLLVGADQVMPVGIMPFDSQAECEKNLKAGILLMIEQVPEDSPFVAACLPMLKTVDPKKKKI